MEPNEHQSTPAENWRNSQDTRTRQHIAFCQHYVQHFGHGAPGHLDYLTIDTLAKQLDTWQGECVALIHRNNELWQQHQTKIEHAELDNYYAVQSAHDEIDQLKNEIARLKGEDGA